MKKIIKAKLLWNAGLTLGVMIIIFTGSSQPILWQKMLGTLVFGLVLFTMNMWIDLKLNKGD